MKNTDTSVSVTWANWFNVLPDLRDKKILKIGADNLDDITSISFWRVASIYIVGEPQIELNDIVTGYYSSLEQCREEKFDVLIVDDFISFVGQYDHKITDAVSKMTALLSAAGVLLIGCSNSWKGITSRRYIKRILAKNKKADVRCYFCDPSVAEPFSIIPFDENGSWLTENYPNIREKPYRKSDVWKESIKRSLFSFFGILNPYRSLVFVLNNVGAQTDSGTSVNQLSGQLEGIQEEVTSMINVCITNYYLKKHYLFWYSKNDKALLKIEKVGYKIPGRNNPLEEEYRNMLLFEDLVGEFRSNNIEITQPIRFYSKTPEISLLSMSVVQGQSLLYIIEKNMYFDNRDEVIKLLDRATDVQIYFQELCEKNISGELETLSDEFAMNYLGVDIPEQAIGEKRIQHGDFAANNIILDTATGNWGIIDWEWLRQGFPPLLDVFSLYTSLRFIADKKEYNDTYDKYYDAFIVTYFSNNWLSRSLLSNLKKYCLAFHLKESDIYTCLLRFLIFHCNKYRIHKYEQQQLYEKMLSYAVNHENEFISNRDFENKKVRNEKL